LNSPWRSSWRANRANPGDLRVPRPAWRETHNGGLPPQGSGSKEKLKPRDLGANGDQIRRLAKQNADVYVVQHVGQFDEAIYDEVRDMILARRSERGDHTIRDGSDCARLFVAHGLIDAATVQPLL